MTKKTFKEIMQRAAKQDADSILVLAGYEFDQGVAYADMQWLDLLVNYWFVDCEMDEEDIAGITGLSVQQICDILIKNDKMGAPVW